MCFSSLSFANADEKRSLHVLVFCTKLDAHQIAVGFYLFPKPVLLMLQQSSATYTQGTVVAHVVSSVYLEHSGIGTSCSWIYIYI